jgi:hypothetical protein
MPICGAGDGLTGGPTKSPPMREAIIRMWSAGEKHLWEQIGDRR